MLLIVILVNFSPLNMINISAVVDLDLDGSGTSENDPYLISDLQDIINFSDYVNSGGSTTNKYFELTNDINLNNHTKF